MASMTVLDQKLVAISGYPRVDAAFVQKVGDALKASRDDELVRINPRSFAETHQLDAEMTLDVFLVGAKVGLFDLQFHLVCPGCGALESTTESWNGLHKDVTWCAVCDTDVPVILDDHVQVTFSPAANVRPIDFDGFRDQDTYWKHFFSSSFVRSQQLQDFVGTLFRGMGIVHGESSKRFPLQFSERERLRVISVDAHTSSHVQVEPGAPSQAVIEAVPAGFSPSDVRIGVGESELIVHNRRSTPMGIMVVLHRLDDVRAILSKHPNKFRPFLSAKNLLNHQRFRELFKAQHLDPSLRLKLRSLTLLFTDLKGSTALYDSTGDVTAYAVVQAHFDALMAAVRSHGGAVVKTMGDAVMASFSSPEDALRAADEMMTAMQPVEARVRGLGYSTGLKVGIHEGAALAVSSDDRLDYFGQTVNIAARVQALADAGEIWVTDAVMKHAAVSELVKQLRFRVEERHVSLKGVGAQAEVYRLRAAQ
jgi:class 3 adenylate cyclase